MCFFTDRDVLLFVVACCTPFVASNTNEHTHTSLIRSMPLSTSRCDTREGGGTNCAIAFATSSRAAQIPIYLSSFFSWISNKEFVHFLARASGSASTFFSRPSPVTFTMVQLERSIRDRAAKPLLNRNAHASLCEDHIACLFALIDRRSSARASAYVKKRKNPSRQDHPELPLCSPLPLPQAQSPCCSAFCGREHRGRAQS